VSEGSVRYSVAQGVATIVFDRPEARNAMTWRCITALHKRSKRYRLMLPFRSPCCAV